MVETNFSEQQPGQTEKPKKSSTFSNWSKSFKIFFIITGLILTILAAVIVYIFRQDPFAAQNQQTTIDEQTSASELEQQEAARQRQAKQIQLTDGSQTEVKEDEYYALSTGKQTYYGKVTKINQEYLALTPTAYKNDGALALAGNELHGPEATAYFKIANVKSLHALDSSRADAAAIIKLLKASKQQANLPELENINLHIKPDQFQAFFFGDGNVFFARTSTLDGNFLATSGNVYVLQTEVGTQVTLMVAKPAQYNQRQTTDLLYWQNMRNDSQVSEAATLFESQ